MTKIEQKVMASVLVVYAGRKLRSVRALEIYTLVLSAAGIVSLVSVSHVAANFAAIAHGGLGGISVFVLSAVLQTKLMVQLALLVGAAALIALLVDATRSIRVSTPAAA